MELKHRLNNNKFIIIKSMSLNSYVSVSLAANLVVLESIVPGTDSIWLFEEHRPRASG